MDRIQSANAQNGQFVDPDPGQGQRGTIADAAFFNGVQEELVGLIEAAGVAPDAGANDQVKKAIFSLIYPINSVYITYGDQTPVQLFAGVGSWAEIGQGRVLVGRDAGQTKFNQVAKVGGTNDLTIPRDGWGATQVGGELPEPTTLGRLVSGSGNVENNENLESLGHAVQDRTVTDGNLPPFLVVRMWRRTA